LLTYAIIIAMDDEGWTIGEFLWKSLKLLLRILLVIAFFYLCALFFSTPLGQKIEQIMDFLDRVSWSWQYLLFCPVVLFVIGFYTAIKEGRKDKEGEDESLKTRPAPPSSKPR
jgi:hypothetical protein